MYFCMASSLLMPIPHPNTETEPFRAFQAFHFAFSYRITSAHNLYSEVEHTRSGDIAIADGGLLEESISGELVLVAHSLCRMPVAHVLGSFLELLLADHAVQGISNLQIRHTCFGSMDSGKAAHRSGISHNTQ